MVQNSQTEATQALASFWPKVGEDVKSLSNNDFKQQELPLARIKKIMKLDDDVKMISAEAPVLFSKAAELFITELTLRAWIHTEDNKRRTLQRNDIAMAISKYDQFDFLIDIVPRDELKPQKAREEPASRPASSIPDQVQYYLQLAQQNNQALQQTTQQAQAAAITGGALAGQQIQIVQGGGQILSVMPPAAQTMVQAPQPQQPNQAATAQSITNAAGATQPQQQAAQQQQQQQQLVLQGINTLQQQQQQQQLGGIQIVQQVVGPNGEIQQIPLQLSAQQLQMIRMQLGAAGTGQQIVLQAAPQQQGQPE